MKADRSHAFWQWFSSAAARIDKDPRNQSVIRAIDEQLSAIGPFSWEIGPGVAKKWFFCISPNRDADLLIAAKRVISAAHGAAPRSASRITAPNVNRDAPRRGRVP